MLRDLVEDMAAFGQNLDHEEVANAAYQASKRLVGCAKTQIYTVSSTDLEGSLRLECDSMGDTPETQRSLLAEWINYYQIRTHNPRFYSLRSLLAEWSAATGESEMMNAT